MRASSSRGNRFFERELDDGFCEDEGSGDEVSDSHGPPPRTMVSARSGENACHESEDKGKSETGSDDGSAMAGSGSDAEEGEDVETLPQRDTDEDEPSSLQRAIERSAKKAPTSAHDEDEIASSPSTPPSSQSSPL